MWHLYKHLKNEKRLKMILENINMKMEFKILTKPRIAYQWYTKKIICG